MPGANPYDLDPEVRALLKIDTFQQGKFTTREFVENMSKNMLKRANPKAFDPKPFIRTFERSIDELLKLRESVKKESKDLETSVQIIEAGHRKKLVELKTTFEDVVNSFETLETRINEVGNTAIRIGEQLETIDRQRLRASESKELIEYFMAFNRNDIAQLENLRTQRGKDGQFKAATIARRLNAIAKEVDIPGGEAARSRIEKYCEVLEKELLEQFDKAYRQRDKNTMQHCAKTLQEFNGCESCIKLYVNQHEFFITKVNLSQANEFLSSPSWSDLPNPQVPPPPVDQGLVELYKEIRTTVKQEAEIINAVFPNPINVMQVFLQRIFAQLVQTYLESLLTHAENDSTLAYLRSLAATYTATTELVNDLKGLDMRQKGNSTPSKIIEEGSRKSNTVAELLDQCIEDLFVPYTEGDRYIEKEKKSLNELYSSLLLQFNAYHIQQSKTQAGSLFKRAVNQITSSGGRDITDIVTTEEDGNLSVSTAMLILKIHAEAIKRSVKLSPPSEIPKFASALFHVLLDSIGKQYVDTALDTCLDQIIAMDSKSEPDFKPFTVIKLAKDIIHLAQNHFQVVILPLASPSLTIHRDLTSDKNRFMMGVENKMNSAVQKLIDVIIARLSYLLSRQKKVDFKPKDEDDIIASLATTPCNNCVEYLKKIQSSISQCLDGKNLEYVLIEIGVTFHSILLEHFKKFTVSAAGGLVLTKDIAKYQETITLFKIPQLDDRFEMLRQLGNLFIVKPEILKSVLNEGYLAKIDVKYLLPYLQARTDFRSTGIDTLLGATAEIGSGERNFNEKARARLAAMGLNINIGLGDMTFT
ncbi:exocyst complex component Sec10-like protein [Glomus cerebriforme]|uniref:Exocyst complex component Sec10-like protein n=1 Tax=Glomus cerebriforme TaxID=658196 RepID=A0A397T796_9GLOM|nr:exocyst complex component Sec10-like protein [Glomus cerebriforme]